MKKKLKNKVFKFFSFVALVALVVSSAGGTSYVFAAEDDVTVTIVKYIEGEKATEESAGGASFQMSATWNASNLGGPGTGQYTLSPDGFNGDPTPYQAVTSPMASTSDYTTSEIFDEVVGVNCEAETPFALVGYSYGNTLEEAEMAETSLTPPAFVGLTESKYVIVWNDDCSSEPPTSVKVQINKYIDGEQANTTNASSTSFTMSATWSSESHGSGTGEYELGPTGDAPYQASTVDFNPGADYSTSEVTTGETVGDSCDANKPFALTGYSSGDTFEEAASSTPSETAPSFTDLMSDKYVIVWNEDCSDTSTTTGGTIGGDVTGGQNPNGTLMLTSVETVDGSAEADGTFENGWKYIFHITAPSNEPKLSMKFADWVNTTSSSTIPVANNVRISSAQADNSGATVMITAADTYATPDLNMIGDLDAGTPGRQVQVVVEARVPTNSVNGSYTTNFGIRTLP